MFEYAITAVSSAHITLVFLRSPVWFVVFLFVLSSVSREVSPTSGNFVLCSVGALAPAQAMTVALKLYLPFLKLYLVLFFLRKTIEQNLSKLLHLWQVCFPDYCDSLVRSLYVVCNWPWPFCFKKKTYKSPILSPKFQPVGNLRKNHRIFCLVLSKSRNRRLFYPFCNNSPRATSVIRIDESLKIS